MTKSRGFALQPSGLDIDRLNDLADDLRRDGQARVDADPTSGDQWIFWLKRQRGFYEVKIITTDQYGIVLGGF